MNRRSKSKNPGGSRPGTAPPDHASAMERPGIEHLLADRLLEQLREAGSRGLQAGDLEAPPDLDADRDDIADALERLHSGGRAVRWKGRWLAVEATDLVAGTVQTTQDGDLLIRSGPDRRVQWYVHRRQGKDAVNGDRVLVRPDQPRRGGSGGRDTGGRLPEAKVVEVIERRHTEVVGTVEIEDDGSRWLVPYDRRLELELEIVDGPRVDEDTWVVVRVEPQRSQGDEHPRGRVIEVLGTLDTPGVDVAVVLAHYRIPDEMPPEVEDVAAQLPPDPRPEDWAGREDLRDELLITIDGASARDFDDAVSLERLDGGLYRLGVHIADVAHYVEEGGVLDREAFRRGNSVYYPERAVPMLPEGLSNGLCSLRPDVPRLAMSVFLDIDDAGRVQRRRFVETVIRSSRRMTYDEVRRLLEEPQRGDRDEYGPVLDLLEELRNLMQILLAERTRRGSIDFDLPEGNVVLDTDGTTVGIRPGERHVAHRIIEECMIAANEAVAFELASRELPALYRVHDTPSRDDLEALRDSLKMVGIRLRGDLDALHPGSLQEVLEEIEGRPEEPFISALVLRTMQRAVYSEECRGHYALASRFYAHFTSPIRRYPDLVVHRSLKALVAGRAAERLEDTLLAERLPGIADHAGTTERRAEQSERDLLQWKKVRFLSERVGEVFSGRITGVQPFGLFVQLDDLWVDGLVPIRALGDDYYVYEEDRHRLVGENHGRVFRLGDALGVRLTGVSLRHRGLDLEPATSGGASTRRRGGGGKRRRRRS